VTVFPAFTGLEHTGGALEHRLLRFVRKVTGLRLLTECVRGWEAQGSPVDLEVLLAGAEGLPAGQWIVDPDDVSLEGPGDMPHRIGAMCRGDGRPDPVNAMEVVRWLVDSLALAHPPRRP
jgi:rhamnulokinase